MKKKGYAILTLIGFVYIACFCGYLLYENKRLNVVIGKQNDIIKATTGKDIDFIVKAKSYKDSISKITEKVAFIMNGDTLTSSKFIRAYEKIESERDSVKKKYEDLLFIHKFAQDTYGFKISVKRRDHSISVSADSYTKADSALIALEFFRDRLKRTKTGWEVNTTGPADLKKIEKQINKALSKPNRQLDSILKNKQTDSVPK